MTKMTNAQLEARVAQLETELAEARAGAQPVRPKPEAPSFGVCAGVAADLEQVDKTVDPFTGKVVTGVEVGDDGRPVFTTPAEPEQPADVDTDEN